MSPDFTLTPVDDGIEVFEGNPGERAYGPLGTVHGGWAATMLANQPEAWRNYDSCRCDAYQELDYTLRLIEANLSTQVESLYPDGQSKQQSLLLRRWRALARLQILW